MNERRDWELLRKFVDSHSQEAFSELTKRYLGLVFGTALRELGDRMLAEDVTQAVFLVLARKAPAFRQSIDLVSWLFDTCKLTANNARRDERRRQMREQKIAGEVRRGLETGRTHRAEIGDISLNQALSTLMPTDRKAILLHYVCGYSFQETGDEFGVSEDAARMRIKRALEKLRLTMSKAGAATTVLAIADLLHNQSAQAPFYHCFGCVLGTAVCSVYGSAIVVPAPTFDAKATLRAIEQERCTSIYGVPTMFVSQIDHPDFASHDLSSLRTGIMAGSPCPLPLMKAVVERMGAREITIGYGLTEASPIITQTWSDDPIEVRVGTVGSPLPGVEVRLIHPVTREVVADGEAGELCCRGHGVMEGYYKIPEATARTISPDGWLATGDLARCREDGNYRIVGRSKELIIRGGENIYPPEVEEYLCHHPAVAEVAVVGLPDAVYGEAVSAWVVAKTGFALSADDIRAFCAGQIAHFKIPKYVEVVPSLPRTVTGKIRKHLLREQGIEQFGLAGAAATPTA